MGVITWWTVWGVASAAIMIIALKKHPHPIRGWLGRCAQGLCALAAVNVAGGFTGVSLGINTQRHCWGFPAWQDFCAYNVSVDKKDGESRLFYICGRKKCWQ